MDCQDQWVCPILVLMKDNNMKARILIASLMFILGVVPMIDWFIFCAKPEFKNMKTEVFKAAYVSHLPASIRPLFDAGIPYGTMITMWLLAVAAILYWKTPYKITKILAILSFILAFWNLFSLM